MLSHMANDIVLKTPLLVESFQGKAAIRPVVESPAGRSRQVRLSRSDAGPRACVWVLRSYGRTDRAGRCGLLALERSRPDTGDDGAVASPAGAGGGARDTKACCPQAHGRSQVRVNPSLPDAQGDFAPPLLRASQASAGAIGAGLPRPRSTMTTSRSPSASTISRGIVCSGPSSTRSANP
jgi:hypothetical protein